MKPTVINHLQKKPIGNVFLSTSISFAVEDESVIREKDSTSSEFLHTKCRNLNHIYYKTMVSSSF
jgi:hypothetical protein